MECFPYVFLMVIIIYVGITIKRIASKTKWKDLKEFYFELRPTRLVIKTKFYKKK